MILRDGRNVVHDLGPAPWRSDQTAKPWLMEPIGYTGTTGTHGWSRELRVNSLSHVERALLAATGEVASTATRAPYDRQRYNRAHRAANHEHYLELEAVRRDRYRAKQRMMET